MRIPQQNIPTWNSVRLISLRAERRRHCLEIKPPTRFVSQGTLQHICGRSLDRASARVNITNRQSPIGEKRVLIEWKSSSHAWHTRQNSGGAAGRPPANNVWQRWSCYCQTAKRLRNRIGKNRPRQLLPIVASQVSDNGRSTAPSTHTCL